LKVHAGKDADIRCGLERSIMSISISSAAMASITTDYQAFAKDKKALADANKSGNAEQIKKATDDLKAAQEAVKNDFKMVTGQSAPTEVKTDYQHPGSVEEAVASALTQAANAKTQAANAQPPPTGGVIDMFV
jgi:hypothetical protein